MRSESFSCSIHPSEQFSFWEMVFVTSGTQRKVKKWEEENILLSMKRFIPNGCGFLWLEISSTFYKWTSSATRNQDYLFFSFPFLFLLVHRWTLKILSFVFSGSLLNFPIFLDWGHVFAEHQTGWNLPNLSLFIPWFSLSLPLFLLSIFYWVLLSLAFSTTTALSEHPGDR